MIDKSSGIDCLNQPNCDSKVSGFKLSDFSSPHTEGRVDMVELRQRRLNNVQREMRKRDITGMLLTNPVHVRYATGTSVMSHWTANNIARYAFIPGEGEPTIFEYGHAVFRAKEHWFDSRKAKTWQYRFGQHLAQERATEFASEIANLMPLTSGLRTGNCLGVDSLDFYGFEALRDTGIELRDADEPMQAARLVKCSSEIELIKQSLVVAESALDELERAIRPGLSENEMLGIFYKKMLSLGGEHCSTRLLTSGEKTNPWFYEAGTRLVRPGDLVAIDTDMGGPEGYLCDISRTFLCGDKATADQREAYHVAVEFIQGTFELLQPGVSLRDVCLKAPGYPDAYLEQSYSCMLHGIGMDDEPPFLPYPHALGALGESVIPDEELLPNTVLSIEFYAGKVGGRDGVKLEDQVLVTENGPEWLSRYPLEQRLSGNREWY